jgi:membrane associated rhomboid family serine protease
MARHAVRQRRFVPGDRVQAQRRQRRVLAPILALAALGVFVAGSHIRGLLDSGEHKAAAVAVGVALLCVYVMYRAIRGMRWLQDQIDRRL